MTAPSTAASPRHKSVFNADEEFSSSSEKYDAFQSYVCKTYWDMDQTGLAVSVVTGMLADKAATAADKQKNIKDNS